MPGAEVIIIGGGLAGLACANRLGEAGVPFTIVEAADDTGGRVRSDVVNDFILDRGFQVFPTAYAEAARVLDFEALELHPLMAGLLIRRRGRFLRMVDPYRHPQELLRMLGTGVFNLLDKARSDMLRGVLIRGTDAEHWSKPEVATLEFLRKRGFSAGMIEGFFMPWLRGVYLEDALSTSSRMFSFIYRTFALGEACLPSNGMRSVSRQLSAKLPDGRVRINTRVSGVRPSGGKTGYYVTTDSGEDIPAAAVVIATEGPEAIRLLNGAARKAPAPDSFRPPGSCATMCLYFSAPTPPYEEPIVAVNGENRGILASVAVPSNVSTTYAPPTLDLICVNTVGLHRADDRGVEDMVRGELREWFGRQCSDWVLLRLYRIPHALPAQPVGWLDPPQRPVRVEPGLYVCGDHRDNASLDGALTSGRRTADSFIADFAV